MKRNMPVILMRNIDKEKGLCNRTRVIVKALVRKFLQVYNPATKEDVSFDSKNLKRLFCNDKIKLYGTLQSNFPRYD